MSQHTPAAKWRVNGEPDPFGSNYDCERHELTKGDLTDDEMANMVFMEPHIGNLQAAKDRIRWLSRQTVRLETSNNELLKVINEVQEDLLLRAERDDDGLRLVNLSNSVWERLCDALSNATQMETQS